MEKEYEIHERVAMKNEGDSLTGDLNLDEEAKAKDSDEVELF